MRRTLAREATLSEVAAAHAEALDVQIRTLRLRRAVLSAVASRGATHQEYAATFGKPGDAALRAWLWRRLEVAADPRVARYWRLLAAINRWPEPESLGPVFDWFPRALRVRLG